MVDGRRDEPHRRAATGRLASILGRDELTDFCRFQGPDRRIGPTRADRERRARHSSFVRLAEQKLNAELWVDCMIQPLFFSMP